MRDEGLFGRRRALRVMGWSALGCALSAQRLHGSDPQWRMAARYSAEHTGLSVLVLKEGRIVFEDYPNGSSSGALHKIYSGTKGFWILTALKAIKRA